MAYTELALYVDSVAYAAVTQFAISTAYTVGQIRRQLAAPAAGAERCFVCIVAGTSAGSEPTWTTTKGAKTVSGTATFQECTALPALNGDIVNTNAWAAGKGIIALGVVIKNTAATHYFICTTSGAAGSGAEPSWNTTTGATTTDTSAVWTCLGPVGSFTTRWAAAAQKFRGVIFASGWQANTNMTMYVGDDHSESLLVGLGPASACQVLCVDHTVALPPGASDLRTTAQISTAASVFWGAAFNGYIYGLQFSVTASSGGMFSTLGASRLVVEQCSFNSTYGLASGRLALGGDTTNIGGIVEYKDCTFDAAVTTTCFNLYGNVRMENCSFFGSVGGSSTNQLFAGNGTFLNFVAEGCDFATNVGSGSNLVGTGPDGAPAGIMQFRDCKIPSTLTNIFRGGAVSMGNLVIELSRTDSGAGTTRTERHTADGVLTRSTAITRTGGAALSHAIAMTANANNTARIFNSVPLAIWNDTLASRDVTVYGLANDSRVPTNTEFWADVEYLGQSGSPDGDYKRGRALPLATAAALTADTSAWDSAATARANSTAYVVGNAVKVASNSGRVFICTTAGTSAGSEPGGYASAIDGGSVTDGTAVLRAACRFRQTLTLSSPAPAQAGYLFATPKIGRASATYYIDPKPVVT